MGPAKRFRQRRTKLLNSKYAHPLQVCRFSRVGVPAQSRNERKPADRQLIHIVQNGPNIREQGRVGIGVSLLLAVEEVPVSDDLPVRDLPVRSRSSCEDCMTRSLCVFSRLGGQQLRKVQQSVRERRFKKGDTLTEEGEVSDRVYVVKVGIAFWRRRGVGGDLWPIGIAGRGAIFGLPGFFGRANQWSGVAISSGRLCEIPASTLNAFAARHPQIIEHFADSEMATCGLIASWSAGMRLNSVVKQLSYAVLLLADTERASVVDLPTQTGLAELLGTTRETVVRAMAVLERSGSLRHIERKKFEVSRPQLMERLGTAGASLQRRDAQPARPAVPVQIA